MTRASALIYWYLHTRKQRSRGQSELRSPRRMRRDWLSCDAQDEARSAGIKGCACDQCDESRSRLHSHGLACIASRLGTFGPRPTSRSGVMSMFKQATLLQYLCRLPATTLVVTAARPSAARRWQMPRMRASRLRPRRIFTGRRGLRLFGTRKPGLGCLRNANG